MAKHPIRQGTVVEGHGMASASTAAGQWTAREIEAEMSKAVETMIAAGEQDPAKIKAAMLDAKDQFIAKRKAEAN
jgi:hypothetical protein